eukprot:PhM_4_TR14536/c0_g1_i1/m.3084
MSLAVLHYLSRNRLHRVAVLLSLVGLVFGIVSLASNKWVDASARSPTLHDSDLTFGLWFSHYNGTHEQNLYVLDWCTDSEFQRTAFVESECESFVRISIACAALMVVATAMNAATIVISVYHRTYTLCSALPEALLYIAVVIVYGASTVPAFRDSPNGAAGVEVSATLDTGFILAIVAAALNSVAYLLIVASCGAVKRETLGFAGREKQLADIAAYKSRMEDRMNTMLAQGSVPPSGLDATARATSVMLGGGGGGGRHQQHQGPETPNSGATDDVEMQCLVGSRRAVQQQQPVADVVDDHHRDDEQLA